MVLTIENFLISPNLPDIIAYLIMLILFIYNYFIKAFVKKDNKLLKIDTDVKLAELKKMKNELQKERAAFEKEKKEIREEIKSLKKAVRISSGNTHELVSSGIAKEVAKMLPVKEDNEEEKQ